MYIVEKETNGLYERINLDQYMKWYRAVKPERPIVHCEHELLGKKFMYSWTGNSMPEVVVIKSVVKHWHAGYYYLAVYDNSEGSSGTVVIENINSIDPIIIESNNRFIEEFKPIN